MPPIILHHYWSSPYAEKIRAIAGYKQLAWSSVFIPTTMPKPDLTALTGGYRKTPVMQIGCDIYCDTKLITRVLEKMHPAPALIPPARAASCAMAEQWSEQLFLLCAPVAFTAPGHYFAKLPPSAAEDFQKDRAALFSGGGARRPSMAASRSELPERLAQLEAQLSASAFLDGDQPSLADFSVYHPIWFILSNPGAAAYLAPYPNIRAWAQRIAAFGHGKPEKMDALDAIAVARAATPRPRAATAADPAGLKLGDTITVAATDYGTDAVSGVLIAADAHEIAIGRMDERAGEVVVHFPRAGFRVEAAKA